MKEDINRQVGGTPPLSPRASSPLRLETRRDHDYARSLTVGAVRKIKEEMNQLCSNQFLLQEKKNSITQFEGLNSPKEKKNIL